MFSVEIQKAIPKLNIHSFDVLKKWVQRDLSGFQNGNLPIDEIKKKMYVVLSCCKVEHVKMRSLITSLLEETNEEYVYKLLNEIYIEAFFSEENYNNKMLAIENSTVQLEVEKRSKSQNYPQTLAFLIVMSNDKRNLSQLDKAAIIVKAALDLNFEFKNNNISTYMNSQGNLSNAYYRQFFSGTTAPSNKNTPFDIVTNNQNSNYIIVMVKGKAYKLEVERENRVISADEIRDGVRQVLQLSETENDSIAGFGALTTASFSERFEIRHKISANEIAFQTCEKAIFILCLDLKPYSDKKEEDIFANQFLNRYFGNTQIVVGAKGEWAIITSFIKLDGTPAIEIADTIYQNSLRIGLKNTGYFMPPPEKISFNLFSEDIKKLEKNTRQLFHNENSQIRLSFGVNLIKSINLPVNVVIDFLLILSSYEITGYFPSVKYAIARRAEHNPAIQLDWAYFPLKGICEFMRMCKKNLDNVRGINVNQVDDAVIEYMSSLKLLLMEAIQEYKYVVNETRSGLSPTSFFKKPDGEIFDALVDFYLELGKYNPAYRNYLFSPYRNARSVDIVISSLKLPDTVQSLGRHGTCSDVFTQFGVHVLTKNDAIELVFIPNKLWINNLGKTVEIMEKWMSNLKLIVEFSNDIKILPKTHFSNQPG